MTNKELIDKAKIIVLPASYKERGFETYNFTEFMETHPYTYVHADIIKDCYVHSNCNEHHFTTLWHYTKLLPVINKLFNIGYKRKDFVLIENKLEDGDFSFFMSKKQKYFTAKSHTISVNKDTNKGTIAIANYDFLPFSLLVSVDYCNDSASFGTGVNTPYHRLFKFTHNTAIINNLSENNGKTLLVSGDSHAIPLLPILCYYYKSVILCDSRIQTFNMYKFLEIDKLPIDDVLLLIWPGNTIDKYTKYNLDIDE